MRRFSGFTLVALALLGCSDGSTPRPFPDAGPMDAALRFDVVGFDVVRSDRVTLRPEVLDFTDVDPLPGQLDADRMDRPCVSELPGDYRFFAEGPGVPNDDRVTLTLPRRFRFERRLPGMTTPAVCETSIPACGAVDAVDVDEVASALTDRDVTAALTTGETLFGCDGRTRGGAVLVVERGNGRLVLGDPCRVCAPATCTPPPIGVQRLTDVLVALRDQELLRPGCVAVTRLDGGAPRDVPADAPGDAPANAPADVPADAPADAATRD
ncbi:MAG: hypothetical protein U0325_18745 [Polyangiales bacterium]